MQQRNKTAVITIAAGESHQKLLSITFPTLSAYANKINSDLIIISEGLSNENPKKLKFNLFRYLDDYERILYLDVDIAVNPRCPNLFELVPVESFGAACENPPFFNRQYVVKELCRIYQIQYPGDGYSKFVNSGVMVISQVHKNLFKLPSKIIPIYGFYDQPYLNAKLLDLQYPILDLGLKFNHTGSLLLRGAKPFGHGEAFIVHATGALVDYRQEYLQFVTKLWGFS
jgi:hypothetical protein